MDNWEGIEYNQISEDWRHRDTLTWHEMGSDLLF